MPYLLYEGRGPDIIFLHATGFNPWLWHPVARRLAPHRMIAPSLCNYRQAWPDRGGLSWEILAKDTAILAKSLALKTPFLVGHSMGATVLVIAHVRWGLPAAAMVLVEPIILAEGFYGAFVKPEDHPLAARALRRTSFWKDRDEARAYLGSRPLFQGWDEEALELYVTHGLKEERGGLSLACPPQQEAALFLGGTLFNPWPLLAKIRCPVLIVEGQNSDTKAFVDLNRVESMIPRVERLTVPGAGHLVPMEKPEELAAVIGGFFRSLAEPGSGAQQGALFTEA